MQDPSVLTACMFLSPCLTNGALWSAGARPGSSLTLHKRKGETFQEPKSPNIEYIKERIGILLLLEILVATVTFTAAFTVPGGYNSSDGPDKGMATMLNYNMFQVFVICITAAFYSSIVSIFFAFWTTLSDIHLVVSLYRLSVCLLGLALGMMSLPFMAAIHLAVNKLTWLASYTLFIGIVSFLILLFMLTCTFPFRFSNPFMQYISYYICQILIILLGNDSIENTGEREPEEIQQFVKDEQQKSSPYGLDKQENLQQSSQEEQTSLKRKHERIIDAAWPRYTLAGNDLDFTLQLLNVEFFFRIPLCAFKFCWFLSRENG
ncbi:uncharacterized protein LOC125370941 [Ricinus communis]|uniref:uncharacterized protein LOC125370941 n=1 Tax=Ricinus communis TaxID=3988 RepID=UPI00201A8984|nr:uncharacterized protein LOC125370941 [Ricinus communis]